MITNMLLLVLYFCMTFVICLGLDSKAIIFFGWSRHSGKL
ncbi:hypothetical protein Lser_V15G22789 [Lactuca serriola]